MPIQKQYSRSISWEISETLEQDFFSFLFFIIRISIKNFVEVTLSLSSNMTGINETNFPDTLSFRNTQIAVYKEL